MQKPVEIMALRGQLAIGSFSEHYGHRFDQFLGLCFGTARYLAGQLVTEGLYVRVSPYCYKSLGVEIVQS